MATAFEEAHADQIAGCLTTVDRLIIHGHLTLLWRPGAFPTFLLRQGIRFSDFARYVWEITDRVKKHAKRIAKEAGRPFIYQAEVVRGKDDLARAIAKRDGITKGLVCVLSTLEMAKSFAFINGRIIPHRRKCLHFYFYLIDTELGFMHVRLQSWFPFQIQIYLNGREWLARQLDRREGWLPPLREHLPPYRRPGGGRASLRRFRPSPLDQGLPRFRPPGQSPPPSHPPPWLPGTTTGPSTPAKSPPTSCGRTAGGSWISSMTSSTTPCACSPQTTSSASWARSSCRPRRS